IESQKDSVKAVQVYLQKDLPNAIGGFVLIDGYLYGASGKSLLCVEFKTGQIKWQEPSIAPGSLCYAEGRLYLHGENGNMALIEATPEKYCELGRFTPPDLPEHKNNREMAWAYPVIADGRLYFRDQDAMWCYKIKAD
ncbi:polyvinylalcohol dehydrogenase, partial [candidate division KSB1 bacterium]|nr:polyvinylalcohol dehydrogenase [candidate division KSB1 bacterium]